MEEKWFAQYAHARENFVFDQERYEVFIERASSASVDGELFILNEGAAHIPIVGALIKEPDFFFSLFGPGATVYGDIVRSILAAEANADVERIVLEIDSPGGESAGFFETAAVIAATVKPIEAQVTDFAASGAFGLATQADRIVVNNSMALVGSVGVATSATISENRVNIASTKAPKKRPDLSTDEGIAAIREQLDAIHGEFASILAAGRGVSVATVDADFGQGAMVIAKTALQAGMIDGIGSETVERSSGAGPAVTTMMEGEPMTLEELRAQHPELYATIFQTGVDSERDRVTAHVSAGRACGQPEIALEFIVAGNSFSEQTVQAKYLTANLNSGDEAARLADEAAAAAATDPSQTGDGKKDSDTKTNEIFDELDAKYGVTSSASA